MSSFIYCMYTRVFFWPHFKYSQTADCLLFGSRRFMTFRFSRHCFVFLPVWQVYTFTATIRWYVCSNSSDEGSGTAYKVMSVLIRSCGASRKLSNCFWRHFCMIFALIWGHYHFWQFDKAILLQDVIHWYNMTYISFPPLIYILLFCLSACSFTLNTDVTALKTQTCRDYPW